MTLFRIEFPLLLDASYLQFLFTRVSFSLNDVVLRLPMQMVYAQNCNLVTTVGLNNLERCACGETLEIESIMKMISNKLVFIKTAC